MTLNNSGKTFGSDDKGSVDLSRCFLVAPISISALYVQNCSGYLAVEPMANFRNLPYCDRDYNSPFIDHKDHLNATDRDASSETPYISESIRNASGRDVLSGTPYISENIVSQPFQNRNLLLRPGMHLHWQLPEALRTGEHWEEHLRFPTAPNCWLVTRRDGEIIKNQWIVESDYLWPATSDDERSTPPSICIPYRTDPKQKQYQPFRHLGRQLTLEEWLKDDRTTHEYWGELLTAIGYGEPAFATFYPNCHSVFGYHDSGSGEPRAGLSYEVVGWHSSVKFDYIQWLISQYSSDNSGRSLNNLIQDKIKWKLDENLAEIKADLRTLYYGCLKFEPDHSDLEQENQPELDSVILANTGTEALSTYIAHRISEGDNQLSKQDIENQLEAIQLLGALEEEPDHLESKLRKARHEKEFVSHSSGITWMIEKTEENQIAQRRPDESERKSTGDILSDLPEQIAGQLSNLNQVQEAYNNTQHELESQRQQIFADWYKYLICLYPPPDDFDRYPQPELVRDFMLNSEMKAFEDRRGNATSLKTRLEQQLICLKHDLDQLNDRLKTISAQQPNAKPQQYQLKSVPSPRYWQPCEPVVMAVLKTENSKTREPQVNDNPVQCFILQLETDKVEKSSFDGLLTTDLRNIVQQNNDRKTQFIHVWRSPLWKPFLLEWEVQVTGVREQSNYFNDFIDRYYAADQEGIDFQLRNDYAMANRDGQKDVYSGRSFLDEYAADQHKQQIDAFFSRKAVFRKFLQDRGIASDRGWFENNLTALKDWIASSQIQDTQKQFFTRLLNIYESFGNLQCLSQSLNGFNQALLGRKQTLQLMIDDPIGFEEHQEFVEQVRDIVQSSIISAPQPLNFFNPIRSGALKITRLRLVDTFGCIRDLEWQETLTPQYLKVSKDNAVNLPPRLVQPARLQFRWLSGNPKHIREEAGSHPNLNPICAEHIRKEAGSHPSLNPICGWILPDRLDSTLEIYNTEGHSLGELEIRKAGSDRWRPAPGSEFAVKQICQIPNPHLQRVVDYLNSGDDALLEDFVQSITQACERIDPAATDGNPSLVMMMGQPIAVVRTTIHLQVQGLPAINQDWAIFKRQIQQFQANPTQPIERETNNFTNVQFPLYLGNSEHLNDGLIGFWHEVHHQDQNHEDQVVLSREVYIPVGNNSEDKRRNQQIIKQPQPLYQTVRSQPIFLTALIDPRGTVQATSRVLPSKSIGIPNEHYVQLLNQLSITFLATPILSSTKINIPLAEATDYRWSWLEREHHEHWLEVTDVGKITRDRFVTYLDSISSEALGDRVWDYLCQKKVGWLKPDQDNAKCCVVDPKKRVCQQLEEPYKTLQRKIELLLDALSDRVRPTKVEASFQPQEIREGWLKLKRVAQS